jgi:TRAP-type C4-dicarboxylate transport system permease small subunit
VHAWGRRAAPIVAAEAGHTPMITRLTDWITRTLLVLAAVLGFMLSFIVVADVIGRVGWNSPLKGTPEMVSTTIVMICFLQAGYAVRSGGMINADFLLTRLPPRAQSWVMAVGALLGVAFFALVCWGAIDPALHAWSSNEFEGEGALRVPSWPARFIVVMGAALAALSYALLAGEHLADGLQGRGPGARAQPKT